MFARRRKSTRFEFLSHDLTLRKYNNSENYETFSKIWIFHQKCAKTTKKLYSAFNCLVWLRNSLAIIDLPPLSSTHPMGSDQSRTNSLERSQRKLKKELAFENHSQNSGQKNQSDNIPTLCSLFSKMPTQESPFAFIPGMGHIKTTEEFAFSPASWEHKDGTAIRSRITRDKRGSKFGPGVRYYMHLEMPGGGSSRQFVLSARKRTRAKTSNYGRFGNEKKLDFFGFSVFSDFWVFFRFFSGFFSFAGFDRSAIFFEQFFQTFLI